MRVVRIAWYWFRTTLAFLMDAAALICLLPPLLVLGLGVALILHATWIADHVIDFVDPEPVDLPKE